MPKLFDYIRLKLIRFINKILGITVFTFSADGEDIILRKFLSGINDGFYVDLGAHDYKDGSNTFYFYLSGWSGVCIDPLPGIKKNFVKYRSRDIFLDKAVVPNNISTKKIDLNYFRDFPDNSTLSSKRLFDLKQNFDRTPTSIIEVETISVSSLINEYVQHKEVNLLNIDIEGGEFEIVKNFIEEGVNPWIICVEEIGQFAGSIVENSNINKYLNDKSYIFMGRTFLSSIYVHKDKIKNLRSPYLNDLILR